MIIKSQSEEEIQPEQLEFNDPNHFEFLSSNRFGVFHPDGGNAEYKTAPPWAMASGIEGRWFYNGELEIQGIGSTDLTSDIGNDIIAFLPGITEEMCELANDSLGINSGRIVKATIDYSGEEAGDYDVQMATASKDSTVKGINYKGTLIGNSAAGTEAFIGQPMGCFQNYGAEYVFYHLIFER